jgi:menaquinone-9 beta-reductase
MMSTVPVLADAEIAVVGAGPAGSVAAFTLASAGHDVVVIDKCMFPRDKACGDGLTPSAVAFVRELELDEVLEGAQPIEGVRLCVDWKGQEVTRMRTRGAGAWSRPCAVPRRRFDDSLVRLACASGARLVRGYATRVSQENGSVRVELTHEGARRVISARHVLAADGATSRLRRQLAGPPRPQAASSYGARRYVVTQGPLDPVFDIYAPLAGSLAGYGWVFPVSERLANVGVGYVTARGLPQPGVITDLLDSFLASLQRNRGSELGSMRSLGTVSGAPLSVGFSADRCQVGRVIFVGDAARTCDPITGEGIDQAMRSAHACAVALHSAIRRGVGPVGIGRSIARSNLRLGQDSAMIARLGHEVLKRHRSERPTAADALGEPTPLFSVARSMLTADVGHPSMAETPAGQTASSLGLAEALGELDGRVRGQVQSQFVLCSELIHREMCAGIGPVGALTLFASHVACGHGVNEMAVEGGLVVEALRTFSTMLSRVTQARGRRAKANNSLAVMLGDYALSRAIAASARLGPVFSEMLAEAIEANSEAAALPQRDGFQTNRATLRYVEWAALDSGTSISLAARMGAHLAGAQSGLVGALGAAGESLGVAVQIAEDMLGLTRPDPVTGCQPWRSLAEGPFSLPVLFAVDDEPRMSSLLRGTKERHEWEHALDVVRQGEGFRRAREVCRRYAAGAKKATVSATGGESPVVEVCDLPGRCLARLSLLAPGESQRPPVTNEVPLRLAS